MRFKEFNFKSNLKGGVNLMQMYKGYIYNRTLQRPKVTIKVGCSLDSKIALKQGQRDSITNKLVQKIVHNYRAEYDAILVGGNTVKIDNPKLNCRTKGLEDLSPYRIILSKSLDFDFNSEILTEFGFCADFEEGHPCYIQDENGNTNEVGYCYSGYCISDMSNFILIYPLNNLKY